MARKALILNAKDNVATALVDLSGGASLVVSSPDGSELNVLLRQDIPLGHKFALAPIPSGAQVVKYGVPIGAATQDIDEGEHVHVHNLA